MDRRSVIISLARQSIIMILLIVIVCHGGGLSQTQSSLVQSFRRLYFIIENSELTPAPIFSRTKQLNKPSNSRQATKATPKATESRTTLSFC